MGGRLAGANTGTGAESAALPVAEDAVRAMVRGCCSTRHASLISSRDLGAKAAFADGAKAAFVEACSACGAGELQALKPTTCSSKRLDGCQRFSTRVMHTVPAHEGADTDQEWVPQLDQCRP